MDDRLPSWYKNQPRSPISVYDKSTIMDVQRTLMCPETGEWDEATITHIKGLQSLFGIPQTGGIDMATAIQIERLRSRYAV